MHKMNLPDKSPSIGPRLSITRATLVLRHLASPKQAEKAEEEKVRLNRITESNERGLNITDRRLSSPNLKQRIRPCHVCIQQILIENIPTKCMHHHEYHNQNCRDGFNKVLVQWNVLIKVILLFYTPFRINPYETYNLNCFYQLITWLCFDKITNTYQIGDNN